MMEVIDDNLLNERRMKKQLLVWRESERFDITWSYSCSKQLTLTF